MAQGLWRTGWGSRFSFPVRGFRLHLHPANLAWQLWLDPRSRDDDLSLIQSLLRPGDTMIDVGANIGFTAMEGALAVGPGGCVHAVEPHPAVHRFLQQNLQLNGLAARVSTHQTAVTDAAPPGGFLSFSDDRRDDMNSLLNREIGSEAQNQIATSNINAGERSGGVVGTAIDHPAPRIQNPASSAAHPATSLQHPVQRIQNPASRVQEPASSIGHPASSIRVPATTLDVLFPGLQRCDLLKIDVEGAELAVLRGAGGLLGRTRQILVEVGAPNSLRSSFSNCGKLEIAAPGRDVFSSLPMPRRYGTSSGTSMATPHVAGCAALWAQSDPSLRGKDLWGRLQSSAVRLRFPPTRVGSGLVQASGPCHR